MKITELSPLVRRITADNSGVFTGPGTKTYKCMLRCVRTATTFIKRPSIECYGQNQIPYGPNDALYSKN